LFLFAVRFHSRLFVLDTGRQLEHQQKDLLAEAGIAYLPGAHSDHDRDAADHAGPLPAKRYERLQDDRLRCADPHSHPSMGATGGAGVELANLDAVGADLPLHRNALVNAAPGTPDATTAVGSAGLPAGDLLDSHDHLRLSGASRY